MLPRALLFSSDEQTATVLRKVLADLHLDLVHCREIFAAIEELTSRSFQALLVDWDQELEASFLLNMARDSKSTKNTYSLVIVDAGVADTLTVTPDRFLEKPFTPEEARNAILSSRALRQQTGISDQRISPAASLTAQIESPTVSRPVIPPTFAESECFAFESSNLEVRSTSAPSRMKVAKAGWRRGFPRPERSVPKKAAALVCLLTLLVAVVHGEVQLGYLPHGLLSYRNLSDLISSPNLKGTAPQANSSSIPDAESIVDLQAVDTSKQGSDSYLVNFARQTADRPVVRGGEARQSKTAKMVLDLVSGGSNAIPAKMLLPTGANPLIPSSLYISPQRLSGAQGTAKPGVTPANWAAGIIAVPEETSRSLLIHQVSPNYPLEAQRAGLQGPVVFQALVGRDGKIEDLKLVRGYFALGLAAVDAVKQWRFRPYHVNGEIVQMQTFVTVSFPATNEVGKPNPNGSLMTYGAWR